jgi:hypothetical protein
MWFSAPETLVERQRELLESLVVGQEASSFVVSKTGKRLVRDRLFLVYGIVVDPSKDGYHFLMGDNLGVKITEEKFLRMFTRNLQAKHLSLELQHGDDGYYTGALKATGNHRPGSHALGGTPFTFLLVPPKAPKRHLRSSRQYDENTYTNELKEKHDADKLDLAAGLKRRSDATNAELDTRMDAMCGKRRESRNRKVARNVDRDIFMGDDDDKQRAHVSDLNECSAGNGAGQDDVVLTGSTNPMVTLACRSDLNADNDMNDDNEVDVNQSRNVGNKTDCGIGAASNNRARVGSAYQSNSNAGHVAEAVIQRNDTQAERGGAEVRLISTSINTRNNSTRIIQVMDKDAELIFLEGKSDADRLVFKDMYIEVSDFGLFAGIHSRSRKVLSLYRFVLKLNAFLEARRIHFL